MKILLLLLAGCGFEKGASPLDLSDLSADLSSSLDQSPSLDQSSSPDLATPSLRVFVTSGRFLGNIDATIHGVLEADLTCVMTAGGGTWRAWLSDGNTHAYDRVLGPGPWARSDGKIAFPGRPTTPPLFPINLDENDFPVEADARVWTGTDAGANGATLATCLDWVDPATPDQGTYGDADDANSAWTNIANQPCNVPAHLYCFEQN